MARRFLFLSLSIAHLCKRPMKTSARLLTFVSVKRFTNISLPPFVCTAPRSAPHPHPRRSRDRSDEPSPAPRGPPPPPALPEPSPWQPPRGSAHAHAHPQEAATTPRSLLAAAAASGTGTGTGTGAPSWAGRLTKGGVDVCSLACLDHPAAPEGPASEPRGWPGVLGVERRCDRVWVLQQVLPLIPPAERVVRRLVCGPTPEDRRNFIAFLQGLADKLRVGVADLEPLPGDAAREPRTLYLFAPTSSVCEALRVAWAPREMLLGLVVRERFVREGMVAFQSQQLQMG